MLFRTLLVAALLLPFAFGNATAATCPPAGEPTLVASNGIYVTATPGVFQESNTRAGLQSNPGSCEDDNGRLISWASDTKLA